MRAIISKFENRMDSLARAILAVVFILIGVAKIAGAASPELATTIVPALAGASSLFWIGVVEVVAGIVMLFHRFYRFAMLLFSAYLIVLLVVCFREYSALLTKDFLAFTEVGDKLVRTIGLVAGALVLLINGRRHDF